MSLATMKTVAETARDEAPNCYERENWRMECSPVLADFFGETSPARVLALIEALEQSVKLQSHYASLLNQYDGGARQGFLSADAWMDRLAHLTEPLHKPKA